MQSKKTTFDGVIQCGNNIIIKQNYTPFYSVLVDENNKTNFDTYLDTLYSYLQSNKVSSDILAALHEIIINEEYCTESMDYDLEIFKTTSSSNIATKLQNKSVVDGILSAFNASKGMLCESVYR